MRSAPHHGSFPERRRQARARGRVPLMARLFGGVFNLVAFGYLLTMHAVLLFGHRPLEERPLPERAPLVIVLDAGARLELGVRLIAEDRADWIHFSAGEGHGLALRYAEIARDRLPPGTRITTEADSLTTLQNAWFTQEVIGPIPAGAILVTDASHLFRAWLCFRWVGTADLHLAPARPLNPAGPFSRSVVREAAATWLTLGRIAAFSGLRLLGRDPDPALLAERPLS